MTGQVISKKLMLLGEIGVGKTSLIRRFVLNEFNFDYRPTMGVDIYRQRVTGLGPAGNQTVELVIWDIDGNYGQSIFRHVYSKGTAGALIVGDLSRAPTIEQMARLADDFAEAMPGRYSALVLNKADLLRPDELVVPSVFADLEQPPVFTSALNGAGVQDVFKAAAATILRQEA